MLSDHSRVWAQWTLHWSSCSRAKSCPELCRQLVEEGLKASAVQVRELVEEAEATEQLDDAVEIKGLSWPLLRADGFDAQSRQQAVSQGFKP